LQAGRLDRSQRGGNWRGQILGR